MGVTHLPAITMVDKTYRYIHEILSYYNESDLDSKFSPSRGKSSFSSTSTDIKKIINVFQYLVSSDSKLCM